MSKKMWFLLILAIIIGVAIGWHYGFSPFQTILSVAQNPTEALPKAWTFVQQHWQALLGGISGMFGTLILAARAYSQHKTETQENLNQIKSESTLAISQLKTRNQTLETKLSDITETYSKNFADMSENYVKVQDQLQDVTAERDQLSKQLADERLYYEKKIDDLEEEKRKAKLIQ